MSTQNLPPCEQTFQFPLVNGAQTIELKDQTPQKVSVHLDHERLRVEVQLQGDRKFPMLALGELVNPFRTLLVVEKKQMIASKGAVLEPFRHGMQSNAVSMQLLYASLPKSKREAVKDAMQSLSPDWWEPEVIWDGLPNSLGWIDELVGDAYVSHSGEPCN